MPARRKPISTKQKKAEIQLKRAIKRGDAPPPGPKKTIRKTKGLKRGPTGDVIGSATDPSRFIAVQTARQLQSAFVSISPEFLEQARALASRLPLQRPIPNEALIAHDGSAFTAAQLTCPRRPKWHYNMTKKEVEHNEQGFFQKWLQQMDEAVRVWQVSRETLLGEVDTMPPSPTYFERNLAVWRQLWRVTEISQILLVLLDSRCPLLHFPPSLREYLSGRKIILVLTKADITGAEKMDDWMGYFRHHYPAFPVVQVESYREKEAAATSRRKRNSEPHLPSSFRETLLEAIKKVHSEMLKPPEKVKSNPSWLEKWKPPVKRFVDWVGLTNTSEPEAGRVIPRQADQENFVEESEATEREFLTIGLIGQPNVGKSSLLNALFGVNKVRASKTPGKTKHFQTLFWTSDVRLVDCPGLVMPNYVSMELQALSGILPISRISAIPSCVHFAAQLFPLEGILHLIHPDSSFPGVEGKGKWREEQKLSTTNKPLAWTAMDILLAYANSKGWLTAKAGRPDVNRAGNAILRALAEGRIGWAFWPPGTDPGRIDDAKNEVLPYTTGDGEALDSDFYESEHDESGSEESEMQTECDSDSDVISIQGEEKRFQPFPLSGRFKALAVDDVLFQSDEPEDESTDEH